MNYYAQVTNTCFTYLAPHVGEQQFLRPILLPYGHRTSHTTRALIHRAVSLPNVGQRPWPRKQWRRKVDAVHRTTNR